MLNPSADVFKNRFLHYCGNTVHYLMIVISIAVPGLLRIVILIVLIVLLVITTIASVLTTMTSTVILRT